MADNNINKINVGGVEYSLNQPEIFNELTEVLSKAKANVAAGSLAVKEFHNEFSNTKSSVTRLEAQHIPPANNLDRSRYCNDALQIDFSDINNAVNLPAYVDNTVPNAPTDINLGIRTILYFETNTIFPFAPSTILKIEGTDFKGNPKTWYNKYWNGAWQGWVSTFETNDNGAIVDANHANYGVSIADSTAVNTPINNATFLIFTMGKGSFKAQFAVELGGGTAYSRSFIDPTWTPWRSMWNGN